MRQEKPQIARNRLPLAARLGPFAGFDGGRGKQEQIHALLAPLARADRSEQPGKFYSLREVCAHFGVALITAAAVYLRLEREGLVARVRGSSGTMIPARAGGCRQRANVRGVVAVVDWLPGFLRIRDRRFFVLQLEKALWDRNFVCELVFYHEEDKGAPAFANRIFAHRPDFAIWISPGPADTTTMDTIADAGVHLAVLADVPVRTRTPQYFLDWREGRRRALRAWKRQGVERVVIPVKGARAPNSVPWFADLLNECGLGYSFCVFQNERMDDYLARVAAQPGGVIFDSDLWQAHLCMQAPHDYARLLSRRRLLTSRTVPIEPRTLVNVSTDAIEMPWARIAERIANDINTGAILRMRHDEIFRAAYRSRVPASRFANSYAYETA